MPKETNQEGQWLQRNKVTIQKKKRKEKQRKRGNQYLDLMYYLTCPVFNTNNNKLRDLKREEGDHSFKKAGKKMTREKADMQNLED